MNLKFIIDKTIERHATSTGKTDFWVKFSLNDSQIKEFMSFQESYKFWNIEDKILEIHVSLD